MYNCFCKSVCVCVRERETEGEREREREREERFIVQFNYSFASIFHLSRICEN